MKHLIILITLLSLAGCKNSENDNVFPGKNWETASYEEAGLNKETIDTLDQKITQGIYGYIDKLLIIRNGRVVVNKEYQNIYENISTGKTSALGCSPDICPDSVDAHEYNYFHPRFHPYYKGKKIHTIQSITKSISATLIGIAIDQGFIKGTNETLLSFFDSYNIENPDARFKKITLQDILTMRSGIEWHEGDRPLDSTNASLQLEMSKDWIRFTLSQPMESEPGTHWAYNSGTSHLMSGIIYKTTGQSIDTYAEKNLFAPLGITEYHWKKSRSVIPDSEGGLYLKAEDLARIGLLYLNNGRWNDQQVLSPDWVKVATHRHVEKVNEAGWGYGYQWWRLDKGETVVWACLGFGGQYMIILPQYNCIGIVYGWNIFDNSHTDLLDDYINTLINSIE